MPPNKLFGGIFLYISIFKYSQFASQQVLPHVTSKIHLPWKNVCIQKILCMPIMDLDVVLSESDD